MPVKKAYNASLTNELLAGNTESLRRTLDILEQDYQDMNDYLDQLGTSIHKCVEFLSIPANLRNFAEYDVSTLEMTYRRQEIRDAFEEVLLIKQEYDSLRDGSW
jgi:hypothetical protein